MGKTGSGLGNESGQTIILLALSLVALCGFLGLAIDVGQMRSAERRLQESADAAALAGALEISYCDGTSQCGEMTTAAQNAMSENGMPGSTLITDCTTIPGTGLSLAVHNGPCALGTSDPNSGNAKFVEAVVTNDQPTYFARVFGLNSVRLSARAEATQGNSPFCIYIADPPSKGGSFTASQGSHIDANCGIDVGTNISLQNGVHIGSKIFDVAGSVSGSSNQVNPGPTSNAPAMGDPLATMPAPTTNVSCPSAANTITTSNDLTISPGGYCGVTVNKGTLTLQPGVYYLQGTFSVGNGANVTGTGVTLYFSSGTFTASSGSNVNLAAPTNPFNTDGTPNPYYGILYWEAATDNSTFYFAPGSKSSWSGVIYLPGATLDMGDGGSLSAYTILVVNSLTLDPGAKIHVNADYSSLLNGSPIKGVTAILAE